MSETTTNWKSRLGDVVQYVIGAVAAAVALTLGAVMWNEVDAYFAMKKKVGGLATLAIDKTTKLYAIDLDENGVDAPVRGYREFDKQMLDESEGICFLTMIKGRLGDKGYVRVQPMDTTNAWALRVRSNQAKVKASARCWKWPTPITEVSN